MIKITETEVFGFRAALRGMRNPMDSWDRSDSKFGSSAFDPAYAPDDPIRIAHRSWQLLGFHVPEFPIIGPLDMTRAKSLLLGGTEHRKFLRDIVIWCDIEPNRGCWQEIDTYKVSTVRNSCSTMHKLGHRDLALDDFQDSFVDVDYLEKINVIGREYRAGGKKDFSLVIKMKRMLPEGFLQKATYLMNYENALNMFMQRKNHRLPEWRFTNTPLTSPPPGACSTEGHRMFFGSTSDGQGVKRSICDWIYLLPYMSTLIEAVEARQAWRENRISMILAELSAAADNLAKAQELPGPPRLDADDILVFMRGLVKKYGAATEPEQGP
jgi:hypothetical protein